MPSRLQALREALQVGSEVWAAAWSRVEDLITYWGWVLCFGSAG